MAIDKLLPHMERGLVYQAASDPERSALHAAGYLRRDELRRRLFDVLPDLSRVRPGALRIGDIPNPVVKRTLVELRKVINAIIRQHGKPDAIHLEMARSMQMGKEKRSEFNTARRNREEQRETAADELQKRRVRVNHDSILRYLLWEEQSHECVYCGKRISQEQLFGDGGEVDVDHILPHSRCLDNSPMNKVVCHRACNHDKGNRTPHEWLADGNPDKYGQVCVQVGSLLRKGLMPYKKYRRFLQKELELDSFIARQLTDTGYIAEATGEYLRCLFDKEHHVLGLKGQLTAELRWQWGLGTILEELPDSPAWHEASKLRAGEKNRADHRHHAIDALVVALTNRRRLHRLSDIVRRGGARSHGEVLPEPWLDFRATVVEAIRNVHVSRRVEHRVHGPLHEETLYGHTPTENVWVLRKPVDSLSANEIDRIRDETIKNIILKALGDAGLQVGRGKKPDAKKMKAALSHLKMPSGVPIKKVRLLKEDRTIQPIRVGRLDQAFVKPGKLHHVCLFEWQENGETKRDAVFVSMLEASRRLKSREPVIQRTHAERPEAKLRYTLCTGDLVLVEENGVERLKMVSTLVSTQGGRIHLVDVNDARRSSEKPDIGLRVNSLLDKYKARKVTVDPLGRIRWAND
jgi:CRISPR-associated endonuclease Csn1